MLLLRMWSCFQMKVILVERKELNEFPNFKKLLIQCRNSDLTAFCFPARK